MSKKVLVVVNMQNDFVTGSLGSPAAEKLLEPIVNKIKQYHENNDEVFLIKDTHNIEYEYSIEGARFPAKHCQINTYGWEICKEILQVCQPATVVRKGNFGSTQLTEILKNLNSSYQIENIEFIGIYTDIDVITNALLVRTSLPRTPISVDASCCFGTTKEAHNAALNVMKSCLIDIFNK